MTIKDYWQQPIFKEMRQANKIMWRIRAFRKTSKYEPHQGVAECYRRRKDG